MAQKEYPTGLKVFVGIMWTILIGMILYSCGNGYFSNSRDRSERRSSISTALHPVQSCQRALRRTVNYPATIRFPFGGYSTRDGANGETAVQQQFSAENAFGVRQDYWAECRVRRNGRAEVLWTRER